MASIQKLDLASGTGYQVMFYLHRKRYTRYFQVGTRRKAVENFRDELNELVRLYKTDTIEQDRVLEFAGIKEKPSMLTLAQLVDHVLESRRIQVDPQTLIRNRVALKNLMDVLGKEMLVKDVSMKSIQRFKEARLKQDHRREASTKK